MDASGPGIDQSRDGAVYSVAHRQLIPDLDIATMDKAPRCNPLWMATRSCACCRAQKASDSNTLFFFFFLSLLLPPRPRKYMAPKTAAARERQKEDELYRLEQRDGFMDPI